MDPFNGVFDDVSPVTSDSEEEAPVPERRNALDLEALAAAGIIERPDAGMQIALYDQFRKIPPEDVIGCRRYGLERHNHDAQAQVLNDQKDFLLPVLQEINAGLGAVTNLASFMEIYKQIAIEQVRKIENARLIPFGRDLYIMAGMMAGVLRADEEHRLQWKKVARFEMHNFHKEAEIFLINEQTMEIDRRQTEKRKAAEDEHALRKMMEEEEARREEEELDAEMEAQENTMIEQGLFDTQMYYRLLQNGSTVEEATAECKEDARKKRLARAELVEPVSSPPRSECGDNEVELDLARIRLDDELNVHAHVDEPFTLAKALALIQLATREQGVRLEDYGDNAERMPADDNDVAQQRRYEEEPAAAPWVYTGEEAERARNEHWQYVPPNQGAAMPPTDSRSTEYLQQQQQFVPPNAAAVAAAPVEAPRREVKQEPQWEEGDSSSEQRVPEAAPGIKGEVVDPAEEERLREAALRSKEQREREESEEKEKREREEKEKREREEKEKREREERRKRAEREEKERRDREKRENQERQLEMRNASTFISHLDGGPQPVPPPVLPPPRNLLYIPKPVPPPVLPSVRPPSVLPPPPPPQPRHRRPASPSPAARAARTAAAHHHRAAPAAAAAAAAPPIARIPHLGGPQPVPAPVLPSVPPPPHPGHRRPPSPSPATARAAAAASSSSTHRPASSSATRPPASSSAAAAAAAGATRPPEQRKSRSRTRSVTMEVMEVDEEVEELPEEAPSSHAMNIRSATRSRSRSASRADRERADVQMEELSDDNDDDLAPVYYEKYKLPLDFVTLKQMVEDREAREKRKMEKRMPKQLEEFNHSTHGQSKNWIELSTPKELMDEYERAPRVDYGVRPARGTLKSAMKHRKPGTPALLTDMIADKLLVNPGAEDAVKARQKLVNLQKAIAMRTPEEKKKKVRFCAAEDPRNKMRLYCMPYVASGAPVPRDTDLKFDPVDDGYDAYIIDAPLTGMRKLLEKTSQMNKANPLANTSSLSTLPYRKVTGSCTTQPRCDKYDVFRAAPVTMPVGKGNDVIFTRKSALMRREDYKREEYTEYDVAHRDYKIIRAIKPMMDSQIERAWLPQLRLYLREAFGCELSRQLGVSKQPMTAVGNSGLSHLVFTDSLLDRVNTFRFPQTYFAIHQQPLNLSSSFRVLCNEVPLEKLMNIDYFIFAYGFDEMLFQQQNPRIVAEKVMHHVIALEKLYFTAANLLRTRCREPLKIARFRVFKLPLIGMAEKLQKWIRIFNNQLERFDEFFKERVAAYQQAMNLPLHYKIVEWETDAIVEETKKLGEEEAREMKKGPYKYNCIDSFARAALTHCGMRTARKIREGDTEEFHLKRKQVDAPGLSKEDHDRYY